MKPWTVDLGNSSAKLCPWDVRDGRARPGECVQLDLRAFGKLLDLGFGPGSVSEVYLVATCAEEVESAWRDALERASGVDVATPGLPHLRNRTRTPETVGRDRLFAAWGAVLRNPEGAIVVDAGTALTVDAVRGCGAYRGARTSGEEPSGNGGTTTEGATTSGPIAEFLGGTIAAGPGILASALSEGGARLPDFDSDPSAAALGVDTPGALASGIRHGFLGAARQLVAAVSGEAGLGDAPVVVSGGAAPYLAGSDRWIGPSASEGRSPESRGGTGVGEGGRNAGVPSTGAFVDGAGTPRRTFWDPWLVHRGLLAAGLDRRSWFFDGEDS